MDSFREPDQTGVVTLDQNVRQPNPPPLSSMGKVSRFRIQGNMLCLIEYRVGLIPIRPLGKFLVGKNTHWQPFHVDWPAKSKPLLFVNNPSGGAGHNLSKPIPGVLSLLGFKWEP